MTAAISRRRPTVTAPVTTPVPASRGARRGAALRRRIDAARDDRGSLPLALLLIMVGLALAAALLPTMIVQDRATVFDGTRMDNLAAAQAGVDVVVGDIRAATSSTAVGNAAALPCTTASTPITGPVNGTGGKATYSAVVSYFVLDPILNPPPPKGTNNPMICINGAGTYDPGSATYVPSFALITSLGTDGVSAGGGGSTGRTITSTYVFKTSDVNFPSGVIRVFPDGTNNWCMDVGGGTPTAGTPVVLQACSSSTPPAAQQLFAYRKDLTLQLSASVSVTAPYGLCLDFNTGSTNPAPAAKNKNPVRLQPCADLGSSNVPYSQQWSYNDNGGFTASLSDSASTGVLSSECIAADKQAAADPVLLRDCGSAGSTQAWLPAPSVGAGGAAYPQMVNFQQFGRCLDVRYQDPDQAQYIAYPCKQNPQSPYPKAVLWNQKFTYDAGTGQVSTVDTNSVNTPGGEQLLQRQALPLQPVHRGRVRARDAVRRAGRRTHRGPAEVDAPRVGLDGPLPAALHLRRRQRHEPALPEHRQAPGQRQLRVVLHHGRAVQREHRPEVERRPEHRRADAAEPDGDDQRRLTASAVAMGSGQPGRTDWAR